MKTPIFVFCIAFFMESSVVLGYGIPALFGKNIVGLVFVEMGLVVVFKSAMDSICEVDGLGEKMEILFNALLSLPLVFNGALIVLVLGGLVNV
ncbi:hypothetical protein [Chitiniphilus eburneus]